MNILHKIFLESGPMIETMMEWRPLTAFGDDVVASTIGHCLNFQQGPNRDDRPRAKLIPTGKTKIYV